MPDRERPLEEIVQRQKNGEIVELIISSDVKTTPNGRRVSEILGERIVTGQDRGKEGK